jgi:hypothetical protein
MLGAPQLLHQGLALPRPLQVGTEPTRQQRQPNWRGKAAKKAGHHFEWSPWPLFFYEVTPTSQQYGMTQLRGCKPDKEF